MFTRDEEMKLAEYASCNKRLKNKLGEEQNGPR
jgi:hypothetical protein